LTNKERVWDNGGAEEKGMKKEIVEFEQLEKELTNFASEYLVSVSKRVQNSIWVWHALLCEDKSGVMLEECYEADGETVAELRLNFLILLAELRKKKLDKVK